MSLRKIDLNLLTVFDAIFSDGNLTRAAQRIGMSQPAMSNALGRLRHLTKDELFVREGRGIHPTSGAMKLAPVVRHALSLIEDALAATEGFDPENGGSFHIGGGDYYEVVVLPKLLDILSSHSTEFDVQATTGISADLIKPLRYGEIDLLIDYVLPEGDEYRIEALLEEHIVTLHRRGHPTIGEQITLEDFVHHRHVFRTLRRDEPEPEVDQVLAAMGHRRDVGVTINNWLAMPAAIAQSDLICTAPSHMAEMYADQFELIVSPLPLDIQPIPVYMMWHEGKNNHPAHRWLRAQLKRVCRKL